jgi:hypothetical protein
MGSMDSSVRIQAMVGPCATRLIPEPLDGFEAWSLQVTGSEQTVCHQVLDVYRLSQLFEPGRDPGLHARRGAPGQPLQEILR